VATIVTILLALNVVFALGTIGSSMMQLELLGRMDVGDYTLAELEANDARQMLLGVASVGVFLVTSIAFLVWFRRAYGNLEAFGCSTAHGKGWAIGAWFVPILSLFRPFQMTRELWTKSDPDADPEEVVVASGPPLLGAWWAAWIVANVLGQASARVGASAETPGELELSTFVDLAYDATTLVSAPLAILVVRGITARQEARAERLAGGAAPMEF
jgi:hypothetical protein